MHFQEEKMENLKFYVDQNAPKTKFDHYWEISFFWLGFAKTRKLAGYGDY